MGEPFIVELPYRGPYRLECLRFGEGPLRVAAVAGLHGTELNGVHALNLVASALRMLPVQAGVVLLPAVNALGIEQGTKRWPIDDRDINQAFPGDPAGSQVERLAHAVLEATAADVCIDVHSGSTLLRELPQVRVPLAGREVELARSTGLPVVWRRAGARMEATGLVGAWRAAGRLALHVRGGRGGTLDLDAAQAMADGVLAVLGMLGVVRGVHQAGEPQADVTRSQLRYHYSAVGGFWVPEVRVGQVVRRGQLLGTLRRIVGGEVIEELRSDTEGLVMTLRAYPVVHARELLVRIAAPEGG